MVRVPATGASATTDAEGLFEITGLAAGTYELVVERGVLASDRRTVETAALFTITKSNVLRPDPDLGPHGNNYNAALQVGEARNRGFEIEFVGSLTPWWQAAVNYTYLDSEILEDTSASAVGEPLPNAAPHSLGLFSRMGLFADTAAGLDLTHIGERIEPYAGIKAAAYTVVDLFVYRQLGRFAEVQLKLENAFDTVYATSSLFSSRAGNFPGQPRTFSVLIIFGGLR